VIALIPAGILSTTGFELTPSLVMFSGKIGRLAGKGAIVVESRYPSRETKAPTGNWHAVARVHGRYFDTRLKLEHIQPFVFLHHVRTQKV
jgi:hypothetical protein